jgi:hypothetical protein
MTIIQRLANWQDTASLGNRMRGRRFALFELRASRLPRTLRILAIGGTNAFWEMRGWAGRRDIEIVTVNLQAEERKHENIESRHGDATNLAEIADRSFDVAFSNSVIEHLFTLENQMAMAGEVRRVARAYWVQTPNYWFPIEPHFHVPGWQWLPQAVRVGLIRQRRCGWRGPCPDGEAARKLVCEVRLMSRRELVRAFPNADVRAERFGGLVKSWIVTYGFPA